jgi:arsenate reductase
MPTQIYQYPKCSTCKKALNWLDAHGVEYGKSDLVADPIPLAKLQDLHRRSGLPITRFFNTSGESYRSSKFKGQLSKMTDRDALFALSKDGKLVKRPILDTGTTVLVGFDEAAYDAELG